MSRNETLPGYFNPARWKEVDTILSALKGRDSDAVDRAIRFLEEDPWFLFSGYCKENLIRRLKQVPLSQDYQQRLVPLIIRSVDETKRREFKEYARLAGILQSAEIRETMEGRLVSRNPRTVSRAKHILKIMRDRALQISSR